MRALVAQLDNQAICSETTEEEARNANANTTNLPTHESNKRRLSDAVPLGHWSWSAMVQYGNAAPDAE